MAARVLIVDDNPSIRRSLFSAIRGETGFDVCGEAENGAEAVEPVKLLQPDAVILDLSMPVMNGLEAAKKIKEIAPRVRIVLFTLHVTPQLASAAREVGVKTVIAKSEAPKLLEALSSELADGLAG